MSDTTPQLSHLHNNNNSSGNGKIHEIVTSLSNDRQEIILSFLLGIGIILLFAFRQRKNNFGRGGKILDENWNGNDDDTHTSRDRSGAISESSPVSDKLKKILHRDTETVSICSLADEEESYPKDAPSPTPQNPLLTFPSQQTIAAPIKPTSYPPPQRPKFLTTDQHPGLKSFHLWHDSITSTFRTYTPNLTTSPSTTPPLPMSERGYLPVRLEITNASSRLIDIFWLDFTGKEVYRGSALEHGGVWTGSTWLGHPHVFRGANGGRLLLHYLPRGIIPISDNGTTAASHEFTIRDPSRVERQQNWECGIQDPAFPFPSESIATVDGAVDWCCRQLEREGVAPRTLCRILENVLGHPEEPVYRQIRSSNRTIRNRVWNNAGRGVLIALGFEENGDYMEMGCGERGLAEERMGQIHAAVLKLRRLVEERGDASRSRHCKGMDGFT